MPVVLSFRAMCAGLCQLANASTVDCLLDGGLYGPVEIAKAERMTVCFVDFKQYCSDRGIQCSQPMFTLLQFGIGPIPDRITIITPPSHNSKMHSTRCAQGAGSDFEFKHLDATSLQGIAIMWV